MYPSWPTTLVPLRKLEIKCENPLTVPPHSSAITERKETLLMRGLDSVKLMRPISGWVVDNVL
ncbi:hypothetical protein FG05_35309 [Fusarium graminearum]|nr:hypothetical protein FG05_35309 [Fusarium graminearum]